MELFLFWLVMAVVVTIVASSKGRNGFGWFLYGFLIWPIALVHAIVVPRTSKAAEKRAADQGRSKCPYCAELIKNEAVVCRYCSRDLPDGWRNGSWKRITSPADSPSGSSQDPPFTDEGLSEKKPVPTVKNDSNIQEYVGESRSGSESNLGSLDSTERKNGGTGIALLISVIFLVSCLGGAAYFLDERGIVPYEDILTQLKLRTEPTKTNRPSYTVDRISELLIEATKLIDEGRYQEAADFLEPHLISASPLIISRRSKAIELSVVAHLAALEKDDLEGKRQAFEELVQLDPNNTDYQRELERYREAISQLKREEQEKARRKAEEAAEKARLESEKRLAQLKAKLRRTMRVKHDKIEGVTWYRPKKAPRYLNSRTAIYLYIGKRNYGKPWLRYVVQYNSSDWLFVESFSIHVDGVNNKFAYDFERDNSTEIWEWVDKEPSARDIRILREIISAKEAYVRFYGRQYRKDYKVRSADKQAIQDALDAYEALGGELSH